MVTTAPRQVPFVWLVNGYSRARGLQHDNRYDGIAYLWQGWTWTSQGAILVVLLANRRVGLLALVAAWLVAACIPTPAPEVTAPPRIEPAGLDFPGGVGALAVTPWGAIVAGNSQEQVWLAVTQDGVGWAEVGGQTHPASRRPAQRAGRLGAEPAARRDLGSDRTAGIRSAASAHPGLVDRATRHDHGGRWDRDQSDLRPRPGACHLDYPAR